MIVDNVAFRSQKIVKRSKTHIPPQEARQVPPIQEISVLQDDHPTNSRGQVVQQDHHPREDPCNKGNIVQFQRLNHPEGSIPEEIRGSPSYHPMRTRSDQGTSTNYIDFIHSRVRPSYVNNVMIPSASSS
ncbi:hypothetical protein LIER_38413 [Lithospermum erythrorhizon]|uniref:Uncharacterized protein n=1 Tax=Lithospermum erythrorhizon TaxID=34254 RepID=A0AAV3Q3K1_LITER